MYVFVRRPVINIFLWVLNMSDYEIAVIGGGPSGSSAASYLARAGFKVVLFEMKNFPRNTVCGEFLSGEIQDILHELGIYDQFMELGPNPIENFSLVFENRKKISSELGFTAFGLQRSYFDNLLLDTARNLGTTVLQPAKVNEIKKEGDAFKITYSYKNVDKFVFVDKVIAAYGRQNFLDKKLTRSFTDETTKLNGIKFQVESSLLNDPDKGTIKIYTANNIYCGINAVDNDLVTICFLENRSSYENSPRQHLRDLLDSNKEFRDIFKPAFYDTIDEVVIYGCGNIYFGGRHLIENGIYMIGDSAGVIAPLSGEGISMALQSGKLIAEILIQQRDKHLNEDLTRRAFEKNWKKLFRRRLITAKIIQQILLRNGIRQLGSFIKISPYIIKKLIQSTRGKYAVTLPDPVAVPKT